MKDSTGPQWRKARMRIGYYIPPEQQRVGGLDLAIRGLQQGLSSPEFSITIEPEVLQNQDLIHFHGIWQPRFLGLAKFCQRARIPYVVSPHGMLEPWAWRHKWWKKWPYFFLFERSFLNAAAGILATSAIEKTHLEEHRLTPPITAIDLRLNEDRGPNYIEARSALGWPDEEFILLYLSRIHPKKGLHLLLAALAELTGRPPALRLVIVGDGDASYLADLQTFISKNKSHLPRIDFLGPVWGAEKWKYLEAADLFCLPTFSENFGLAVLEACQVGTPVLTTNATPWGPFLARHGLPLAEPSVESICDTLAKTFAEGKMPFPERAALAKATHDRFGGSQVSDAYANYYTSLVGI
jgi:glycosyltransferase involved in cell wall biosynthesis